MNMFTVGLNHKTCPVEVREKFYLKLAERELLLSQLKDDPCVMEAIVLSTCNRTEIYAHIPGENPRLLLGHLFKAKKIPFTSEFKKHFYIYSGEQSILHLFQVSAGLDSLILGERQILGQLKEAIDLSRKMGMMGKQFNILSNMAIEAGEKARNETRIAYGGSSISWAAVRMAEETLGSLRDKSVLIIGTGKMGYLAINYLKKRKVNRIFIMNRTHDNATALAREFDCTAVGFLDIQEVLSNVDICICSASAPHYLIEKDLIERVMARRGQKKLLFIDISMPRNINPEVSSFCDVSLVALDDLDKVVEDSVKTRHGAVKEVEEIIHKKICEFYEKLSRNRRVETAVFVNDLSSLSNINH